MKSILTFLKDKFREPVRAIFLGKGFEKRQHNFYAYAGASLHFDKTSKILIHKGIFKFHKKWVQEDPFPSMLSLGKNAVLEIEDSFSIFFGSQVSVHENAVLKLGGGIYKS